MKKAVISLPAIALMLGFLVLMGCGTPAAGPSPAASPAASSSTAASPAPSAKPSAAMDQIIEGAKKEGKVVIYSGESADNLAKIMGAFQKEYPFIKEYDNYTENNAGGLISKALMESKAGADTADIIWVGPASALPMIEAGFVRKLDYTGLGIDRSVLEEVDNPIQVRMAASINTLAWNTELVPASQAPKTLEDLLDPKWKGKTGTFVRPNIFADLVPVWGAEKAESYLRKYMENKPFVVQSASDMPSKLAAGEYAIAIVAYHHGMAVKKKGAPIDWIIPDPTSVTPIDAFVTTSGKYPNAGQLLLSWLASPEGATLYEQVTTRGNPWVPGTPAAEMVKGVKLSFYGGKDGAERERYMKLFQPIITP